MGNVTSGAERARESYNRLSRWYDVLSAGSEARHAEEGLRRLSVQAGERVLEIGFGTGRCLIPLARAVGPAGRVSGIDVSDGMLEVARKRLTGSGLEDRVALLRGDAAALPYGPACFDAVFMSFALELFESPRRAVVLAECRRVLRDGGRLCVVAMSSAAGGLASRLMLGLYRWAHERFPSAIDCEPMDASRALVEAGFSVASSSIAFMWGLPVEVVMARKAQGRG